MTSWRQFQANRRNSRNSTGPRTEHGKAGIAAERPQARIDGRDGCRCPRRPRGVPGFRNPGSLRLPAHLDHRAGVRYPPRLASLIWRLRRTAAIETGLLQIHAEILSTLSGARHPELARAEDPDTTFSECAFSSGSHEDRHWAYAYSGGHQHRVCPSSTSSTDLPGPLPRTAPPHRPRCARTLRSSSRNASCAFQIPTTASSSGSAATRRQCSDRSGQTLLTLQAIRKPR